VDGALNFRVQAPVVDLSFASIAGDLSVLPIHPFGQPSISVQKKELEMSEKFSFIVVKYPKKETANAALAVVLGLAKEKVVKLKDAVVITKTEKGKLKLHQTKDDTTGKGLLKGGVIGLVFAVLFGPAGWIAAGALLGAAFATFDRGIKNKLQKELGEKMTTAESAMAVLVEQADWSKVKERMAAQNFQGEIIVSELVEEHLAEVEKLAEKPEVVATVPDEVEVNRR
jgi:uncharacterized membrane protein